MAFLGSVAFKTGKTLFFLFGISLYAVSWGLLGLGVMLASTEGIPYVRNLLKKLSISLPFRSNGLKKDGNP